MTFWDIVILASAAFLCLLAVIIFDVLRGKELKKELTRIAGEFGNDVSVTGGYSRLYIVQFERDGTVFNGRVSIGSKSSNFTVGFDLPYIREKFFIRHKSFMASITAALDGSEMFFHDCQPVTNSPLSEDYLVHSLNPGFLLSLLSTDKVVPEIVQYDSEWGRFVRIAFDSGHFEVTNHTDGAGAAEKYRQVCETAVVFYDRIKSLTRPENQI